MPLRIAFRRARPAWKRSGCADRYRATAAALTSRPRWQFSILLAICLDAPLPRRAHTGAEDFRVRPVTFTAFLSVALLANLAGATAAMVHRLDREVALAVGAASRVDRRARRRPRSFWHCRGFNKKAARKAAASAGVGGSGAQRRWLECFVARFAASQVSTSRRNRYRREPSQIGGRNSPASASCSAVAGEKPISRATRANSTSSDCFEIAGWTCVNAPVHGNALFASRV